MADGSRSLESITPEECASLLALGGIGRLGFDINTLPAIMPVNYQTLGSDVVFLSAVGRKLTSAHYGAVVAFEIDSVDAVTSTGWSVVAVGNLEEITDDHLFEQARKLDIHPWAPGGDMRYIRIVVHHISGRRIVPSGNGSNGSHNEKNDAGAHRAGTRDVLGVSPA